MEKFIAHGGEDRARGFERFRFAADHKEHRAFFEGSECAVGFFVRVRTGTPENFFERGRIADDSDENVGGSGGFSARSSEAGSRRDQRIGARCGAVPYDQRESSFEKIVAHRTAHEAKSDEADSRLRQDSLHGKNGFEKLAGVTEVV